jgi:XRE family transcriptional regulator of biofilm formation
MYYNKLKSIRKERKLTLEELSEKCGISAGYLCHLENGTRTHPSIEVMEKIAKSLNKTIFEIFFNKQ